MANIQFLKSLLQNLKVWANSLDRNKAAEEKDVFVRGFRGLGGKSQRRDAKGLKDLLGLGLPGRRARVTPPAWCAFRPRGV
jgi:hypothetical protein